SFLNVTRSQEDVPAEWHNDVDWLIGQCAESMQRIYDAGAYRAHNEPSLFLYRLEAGDHTQTGVMGLVPVTEPGDRRVLRHAFDATRREDAARWAEATAAQFGRIDIVINNAGISGRFAFDALDEDVLDNMWEVNVKAPYRVISAALPHLRACGEGRIVNVVSLAGMRQLTSSAAYTISKFAAMGLTHSARHYLFEDGIRVTALCPGDTDTDMTVHSPRPNEEKTQPEDLAEIVSHVIALPNTASIATVPVNCIAEAFL
ncbi:MAG: SDR family NAD(P)-dependent oxidoreductase, partial [Rhodospirillaceae bacterium]|nr:SDR family NAD(P)-dependent oxidoreductase [Rhodospirillaceae bacterium]